MVNLTHASRELFRRRDDERFANLAAVAEHCRAKRQQSEDRWHPPQLLRPCDRDGQLSIAANNDGEFQLNDWSFTQLCGLARVGRDTVNRLTADTASRVFRETLPHSQKPIQLLTTDATVRSIHGVAYTRLWDLDLVNLVREFATDFQPPPVGFNGATGLYVGEQDMFLFLIDPNGWADIGGQQFAPGFFVWNSEVGKRSVGISTFWYQSICGNHIVWDATEVVEVTRKHTAGVNTALTDIRRSLESLVATRDTRRDGFVRVMRSAMEQKLGDDRDEVLRTLTDNGISRPVAQQALQVAELEHGRFTIFALVDTLTRLARRQANAGDRLDLDRKAAGLLALAT